jgi:hypothetical protein
MDDLFLQTLLGLLALLDARPVIALNRRAFGLGQLLPGLVGFDEIIFGDHGRISAGGRVVR